jgi:pteridine reductase
MSRPRILVTGASRRIGREIAVELARRGCDLVLTSTRGAEGLFETVAAVAVADRAANVELRTLHLEDPGSIAEVAASLADATLDGLVHNASVYEPSPLGALDAATIARHLAVHGSGPLLLTAALRPILERSSLAARPAIALLLDIHASGRPRRGWSSYLMSKAAKASLVEVLAVELAPAIRTVGLELGAVLWPEGSDPDLVARYESRIPLGRSGSAEEVARATAWALLEASYVTGETIRLDGGRWLR